MILEVQKQPFKHILGALTFAIYEFLHFLHFLNAEIYQKLNFLVPKLQRWWFYNF